MTSSKGGQPPYQPTDQDRKTVESMAGFGVPQEDICKVILNKRGKPIALMTLRKHFRAELDTGMIKANAKVAQSLHQQAVGEAAVIRVDSDGTTTVVKERVPPSTSAGIWWTKSRMGWRETVRQVLSGDDDAPSISVIHRIIIDPGDRDS
jgi:hypothetical protein